MTDSARDRVLVTSTWAEDHLGDPQVRFVEVDVDTCSYHEGHLPGALAWNWRTDLADPIRRDILSKGDFEDRMTSAGIEKRTTVVLYGDNNNWFAAWAFWQMKIYGHDDVRLMDGGRRRWLAEGRSISQEPFASPKVVRYDASPADGSLRALLPEVVDAMSRRSAVLIDVRSPAEFSGELLSPPGLAETCQRGGHVPGATSIPWGSACREDGTFKSTAELTALYAAVGVTKDRPAITYCRIGERSSHTWFALRYLVGVADVRNYDGSWTEWGNLVGAAIERGA